MAKNKKKKKNRNKDKQALHSVSASNLFHQGKTHLEKGKYRDAVTVLKMAAKKGWPRDAVDGLLAKAYSLRAVQLREKGMETEAAEVQKHAGSFISSCQMLTDEDLFLFIQAEDIGKAVSMYVDFLEANPSSKKIEQHLAERFLVHPKWELVEGLDNACALKKDVSQVKDAVRLMTAGEWENAYETLKPIPRSSPWAFMRILCHAMVCFYKEDDTGMQRALNMIADGSVLKPLFRKLTQDIRSVSCLWDGPVHLERQVAALCDEMLKNRFNPAGDYLKQIAETVSPREPNIAIFHILELFWSMTGKGQIADSDFFKTAYRLLPQPYAALLEAKMLCLLVSPTPFHNAAVYLSMFEVEFPDEEDRNMAFGIVIQEAVENYQRIFSAGIRIQENGDALKKSLHLTSESLEALIAELLVYLVRKDPGNREACEMLVRQMCHDREIYPWIEEGLLLMQAHFPDDPYPCMELAKLYYRKNAYRKAEKILETAMTRAPHDRRVIDMHVMSLLISADKNIARGNLPLAEKDIEKAQCLTSPEIRFLVTEKQILLAIAEKGQMALFKDTTMVDHGDVRRTIDEFIKRLPLFEGLRSLGVLWIDVNSAENKKWDKKMIRVIDKALRFGLKSVDALTPSETDVLLMPLSLDLPVVFRHDMAEIFVQRAKGILARISDPCIVPVFDSLIGTHQYDPVLKEIKRRREKADKSFAALLSFYEVTVEHFKGKLVNNEPAFSKVLDKVRPGEMEKIRAVARRLSTMIYDQPALKMALEYFDFSYLTSDYRFTSWDDGYDEYDDDEYDDEYDDDEFFASEFSEMTREIVKNLENLIKEAGLTGAPKKAVLKFKKVLLDDPNAPPLDIMAEFIDNETVAQMSRELRIFLYGKA